MRSSEDIIEELCDIIDSYELDEEDLEQLINCISGQEDDEEDSCCGKRRRLVRV